MLKSAPDEGGTGKMIELNEKKTSFDAINEFCDQKCPVKCSEKRIFDDYYVPEVGIKEKDGYISRQELLVKSMKDCLFVREFFVVKENE